MKFKGIGTTKDRRPSGGFLWVCVEDDGDTVLDGGKLIENCGSRTWVGRCSGRVFEVSRWDGDDTDRGSRWMLKVYRDGMRNPCPIIGRTVGLVQTFEFAESEEFRKYDKDGNWTENYEEEMERILDRVRTKE